MKICIAKTMVEFGPSEKTFNGDYLVKWISVDTKSAIINNTSIFIPQDLATSIQS